eukprot:TRINITY_DN35368_c0_g1_i1.p1 TRINITY_DN35368_c0_g1~~TRINITY_DN35368_c0_g1_i1.p1  ORF type:complete len:109 (+),score=1.91 TRINITY_DN35368_c0_g1_i1:215-541(+)
MFFFFVGGLNQEVRSVLQRGVGRCFFCGSETSLVEYDKVLKLFFVPVWRWPSKSPALYCDNCRLIMPQASLSAPPPGDSLVPEHLRCWSCSRVLQREFSYCPYCGSAL